MNHIHKSNNTKNTRTSNYHDFDWHDLYNNYYLTNVRFPSKITQVVQSLSAYPHKISQSQSLIRNQVNQTRSYATLSSIVALRAPFVAREYIAQEIHQLSILHPSSYFLFNHKSSPSKICEMRWCARVIAKWTRRRTTVPIDSYIFPPKHDSPCSCSRFFVIVARETSSARITAFAKRVV